MKKCDDCAYFEKLGKKIIRKYSDERPEEISFVDNCLLGWWISGDSHEACEEWITEEDLKTQIEESQLFERERRESECWDYECRGDERYHEELCGIRSNTKKGWM